MSEAWLSEDYHPLLELLPQTSRSEDQRIKHKATAISSMKSFSALNFKKKDYKCVKTKWQSLLPVDVYTSTAQFCRRYLRENTALIISNSHLPWRQSIYIMTWRQTAFIASVWGFALKIICTEQSRCESIFHGYYCRNAIEVFVSVLFSQFWSPRKSNLPIKLWMSSCSF